MPIALVQTVTQVQVDASSATSFNLTVPSATNGNALVFLGAVWDNNATFTISSVDDAGNSWTTRTGIATGSSRAYTIVSHAQNITGGTRTVTLSLADTSAGANRFLTYGCLEFSGVATSAAEDVWDANDDFAIDTNDLNAGPITTTDAGDVLVGAASIRQITDNDVAWASPTSWTNSYRENLANTHQSLDAGYWLPGAVQTTYTAQWTHDNEAAREGSAVIIALRPAASAVRLAWMKG